jgi:hypothetical protein
MSHVWEYLNCPLLLEELLWATEKIKMKCPLMFNTKILGPQLRWMITFSSGCPTKYLSNIMWVGSQTLLNVVIITNPYLPKIKHHLSKTQVTVVTKLLCCTVVGMVVVSLVIMNLVFPRVCMCIVHYPLQISKEPYRTICHYLYTATYLISDAVKKISSHPKLNIVEATYYDHFGTHIFL